MEVPRASVPSHANPRRQRAPRRVAWTVGVVTLAGALGLLASSAGAETGGWRVVALAMNDTAPMTAEVERTPAMSLEPVRDILSWLRSEHVHRTVLASVEQARAEQAAAAAPKPSVTPTPPARQSSVAAAAPVATPAPVPAPAPVVQAPPPSPPAPAPTAAPAATGLNARSAGLFTAMNQHRASGGVGTLQIDAQLNVIAQHRAQDMSTNGYFAHVSPSGESWLTLINAHRISLTSGGENLARVGGDVQRSVDVAITKLMESPTHRENIMMNRYSHVGVAAVTDAQGVTVFVTIFAGR